MKAFIVSFFVFMSSVALAATYEVPVSAELKDYAVFELQNFQQKQEGNKIIISYEIPVLLTGTLELISLEGLLYGEEDFQLVGKNAKANCHIEKSTVACSIVYNNINIDPEKTENLIKDVSKSNQETLGRLQVMRAFSSDPVGVITY